MHIGVFGSGYLGSVVSACLADFGLPVTCFDEDVVRVTGLAQGDLPFHERNLQEVVRRNVRAGRLIYSTEVACAARRADIVYLAQDNHFYIEDAAARLSAMMDPSALLVISTPVPVGTASRVEARLRAAGAATTVVSQPVFLTSGCAVEDFNWPDRILLGTACSDAVLTLKQVYRPLVMRGVPVIVTSHETAELAREASTAFLATKVAFINQLSAVCEHAKADATDLALALGLDKRIGPRCLQPGAGFGGPFAEADMDSLTQLADTRGATLSVLTAAREFNRDFADRLADKIERTVESLPGKELGLLGLSFKPNTNSITNSCSLRLARSLVTRGAQVRAYDPVAIPNAQRELNGTVRYCDSAYNAAEGVDALVLGTAWPEFRALDFERIKRLLKQPIIVDTKNLLDPARLRGLGFQYVGVGRV
jgi:UDPglucose 6-dehydrogenase